MGIFDMESIIAFGMGTGKSTQVIHKPSIHCLFRIEKKSDGSRSNAPSLDREIKTVFVGPNHFVCVTDTIVITSMPIKRT